MRLRTLLLVAACLAASPAFADDDIPTPQGVPMGPVQNGNPDDHPSQAGDPNSSQSGSDDAINASGDNGGSTFDGSASHDGDPSTPGGTHVEPNGDP